MANNGYLAHDPRHNEWIQTPGSPHVPSIIPDCCSVRTSRAGARHQCYVLHNRQYRQCVAWLVPGLKANSYPNLSCRMVLVLELAWSLDSSHQLPLPGSGRADAGPAQCSEGCMDYGLNKYVDMLQFTLRHYRIILMTYRQLNVHIVVCNHVSPQIHS